MGTATHHASGREGLHIGGGWRTPDDHIEVTDLADGERFPRMAAATPADVGDAFAAAERAEPALRETTVVQRAE